MTNGFDRLLRESLADETAAEGRGECLDATLLAAWFDRTLPHSERTAVENHAASCSRCQAMVAALVRTDRPAPRVWWHAPAVRWLVPIAVAAASVVLWIAVFRPDRPAAPAPAPASSMARVASPAPRSSEAGEITAAEQDRSAASIRAADNGPAAKAQGQDASARRERRQMADAAAVRDTQARRAGAAESAIPGPRIEPLGGRLDVAPPVPQPIDTTTLKASVLSPTPVLQAGAAGNAVAAPHAPVPVTATSTEAAPPLSRNIAESVSIVAGQAGRPGLPILSPDAAVRWRVSGAGQVERSVDMGLTWHAQSTGVTAVITAGVAPSANVCWLVGRRGVVLKTSDGGQTWTRVSVPSDSDLVAVVADDDKVASVTAAGGRQLHTTDGGRSWR